MNNDPVRLGVIGLGRAFTLMLPSFLADPRIRLVAACDPRPEARARFTAEFAGPAYEDPEALCRDGAVEAVYIASPHQHHAAQTIAAAAAGRHVLVEKPMALSLAECHAMVAAAEAARVHVIVGHSHSFDAPIRHTRALIAGGNYGRLRMIQASYATDFLYRPRRPEELDTAQGGGAVFNQAPHQVDIVRLLGGGLLRRVRAQAGAWDATRPTEGAYAALLTFEDGAFASLAYTGYAHFDGDALCDWIGEAGQAKQAGSSFTTRLSRPADPAAELARRGARGYGAATARPATPAPRWHEHFGFILASCDGADLRPLPDRVMVYADGATRIDPLPPPDIPRREVLDALVAAVRHGQAPLQNAAWGLATMEACLAILESSRSGTDVMLRHQIPVPA